MTERSTSSERLSERDVDRLLQNFFHDEVPPEFRRDEPAVTIAQPQRAPAVRAATSDSSRNLAGLLGILVSASCCLAVTMFMPGTPAPPDEGSRATPTMAGDNDRYNQPVIEAESVPVEERSHTRITTMGNHEAEAEPGSETEKAAPLEPELEIEIFPLRPDKPRE